MGEGHTHRPLDSLKRAGGTVSNRIVLSLIAIFALSALGERYLRPVRLAAYHAAVTDYSRHRYARSLEELKNADAVEPNDPAVLALMGWDSLRLAKPARAEKYFRRAHWLDPANPDPLLGEIYAEISLEKYTNADRRLKEFEGIHGKTCEFENAHEAWAREMRLAERATPRNEN